MKEQMSKYFHNKSSSKRRGRGRKKERKNRNSIRLSLCLLPACMHTHCTVVQINNSSPFSMFVNCVKSVSHHQIEKDKSVGWFWSVGRSELVYSEGLLITTTMLLMLFQLSFINPAGTNISFWLVTEKWWPVVGVRFAVINPCLSTVISPACFDSFPLLLWKEVYC